MSISVNIYYSGVNGNAKKFMHEMESSGTAAAIRAEVGNLRYEYFFPANMPSFLSSNIRMFTISSGLNKLFIISCAVIFICLPPS